MRSGGSSHAFSVCLIGQLAQSLVAMEPKNEPDTKICKKQRKPKNAQTVAVSGRTGRIGRCVVSLAVLENGSASEPVMR